MNLAVIGGGPAGLMAAEVAAGQAGLRFRCSMRNRSVGRNFAAGRGGLNITNAELRAKVL